jgi:hypothetical protein
MLADQLDYVIGVDPHRDAHALAIVDVRTGTIVVEVSVAASSSRYARVLELAELHAPGRRAFAIEGTGSFGAGLTRFLTRHGDRVLEVGRLRREPRRAARVRARRARAGGRLARRVAGGGDAAGCRWADRKPLVPWRHVTRLRTLRRLFPGGSAANEQLTAAVASVLLVLLAVEGATLLDLRALLTVHGFVGMLLVPVATLKLASTGWRMLRYYLRGEDYVRRGPPHVFLRTVIAPLVIVSTISLLSTGVALLVRGETQGTLVGLHKASFVVWLGAMGVHVLVHALKLPRQLRQRVPGVATRFALVGVTVAAGGVLAIATLPAADQVQDRATAQIGFDAA